MKIAGNLTLLIHSCKYSGKIFFDLMFINIRAVKSNMHRHLFLTVNLDPVVKSLWLLTEH